MIQDKELNANIKSTLYVNNNKIAAISKVYSIYSTIIYNSSL